MKHNFGYIKISIAAVCSVAMLFLSCEDTYERVGEEARKTIYPQGVARNFTLTYTKAPEKLANQDVDTTKIEAVLSSPISEDFENLRFPHRIFPEGLQIDFYDEKNTKSIIKADYAISYSATNLIDLRGNVVIESADGKKLETPQLFWDRTNEWIFTQEKFKYTNPEDGSVMDGVGMDFNREFSILKAHKTFGFMMIKEELDD